LDFDDSSMLRRPANLTPSDFPVPHCTPVPDFSAIEPLIALCAGGRLYEVETWIAEGRPIQCIPPTDRKLQRRQTPLLIAVSKGFHSLAALLLANGYNPNGDHYECLSPAVRARDHGMIDLLLHFGADPSSFDFADALETYDRPLMDRFIEAGVDPCADNAVAGALRHKARPLLGFVKTYRDRFPALQRQIDIALHVFVREPDEKGVALMLWLGADPYAITPESAYTCDETNVTHECAMVAALWSRQPVIIDQLLRKPIPPDRVGDLFRSASYHCCPKLIQQLLAAGADPNLTEEEGDPVLESFITTLTWRWHSDEADRDQRGLEALELVLAAGAKWNPSTSQLRSLRRRLLDGQPATVSKLIGLLEKYGTITADQLHELTRTPAIKRLLNGYAKPVRNYFGSYVAPVQADPVSVTPAPKRGYWKRHWSQR
jgi:hypothetical protein